MPNCQFCGKWHPDKYDMCYECFDEVSNHCKICGEIISDEYETCYECSFDYNNEIIRKICLKCKTPFESERWKKICYECWIKEKNIPIKRKKKIGYGTKEKMIFTVFEESEIDLDKDKT